MGFFVYRICFFFFLHLCQLSAMHTGRPDRQQREKKRNRSGTARARHMRRISKLGSLPRRYTVLGARATRRGLSKVSHRRSLVPGFNESRSESDAGGAERGRRTLTQPPRSLAQHGSGKVVRARRMTRILGGRPRQRISRRGRLGAALHEFIPRAQGLRLVTRISSPHPESMVECSFAAPTQATLVRA